MKKISMISAVCITAIFASLSSASWAQARAWRCPNNHYTNVAKEAQEIGGCTLVEGGNITVVNMNGGPVRGRTPSISGSSTSRTPVVSSSPGMQVSTSVQGNRDSDALKLLEIELSNKQNELAMLQSQYNSGNPDRLMIEANDEAMYQARVERLSREIERKVADINAIQSEISRRK